MPADKSTTGRRALQPACDACHVRRVKCSHDQPCAHCTRLGLSCTYTKASTAKKTAGKRIEALRQAEKGSSLLDAGYRDGKMRGAGGHAGWGENYAGNEQRDEARPHEGPRDHSHHFYTNHSEPAQQNSFSPLPTSSAAYPPHSSMPWTSLPSPRGRQQQQQQQLEYERQVRFQQQTQTPTSVRPGSPSRVHYNVNGLPPYSMQQQQPMNEAHGPQHYHPYPDEVHQAYLPSPSQYFAQPAPRNGSFGGRSMAGEETLSASSMTMEESLPIASADFLQTSILPPFSTSMADSLFNEQGVFAAEHFFSDAIPPPLVATSGQQTMLDMLGVCAPPSSETPGSVGSAPYGSLEGNAPFANAGDEPANGRGHDDEAYRDDEPHALSDSVLIPTLALFYEKLGGVMPVFSRNWLFSKLDKDDHHNEAQFAAMLLAMSALTIIQAQPASEGKDKKTTRTSNRKRRARAVRLLDEALKTREGPLMGQHASLEACFTSFFIFAALFGLGEHSAAWYRLRESITLGHLCRLHEPASYEGLAKDEAERRLRAYWLLAITERAFAIQRGMPIILTGNPRAMTQSLRAKFGFKELSDFPDLQLKLFDVVDENFVDCWNRKCPGQGCRHFDRERALALWRSFTDSDVRLPSSAPNSAAAHQRSFGVEEGAGASNESSEHGSAPTSRPRSHSHQLPPTPGQRGQIQRADVEVTRHWLLNRLWLITLSHGLLSIDAKEPPLRVDHAIHVAKSVLDICNYNLSMASMEAHGVGFTYKLYDIAQTLVMLCKDEMIAEAISKGGLDEQLKAQTTAAHTKGRGASSGTGNKSPSLALGSMTMLVDTSGPAGLRQTVLHILNQYLVLFTKFRQGDHPYLGKLEESINEVKAQAGDDGRERTTSGPAEMDR